MSQRIKKILMERDGLSSVEASDLIRETRTAVAEAIDAGCLDDAEEVVQDMLGLEPDYLDDFLY
jgi:hypothetical protein